MSRAAPPKSSPVAKGRTSFMIAKQPEDEKCPQCKTSRYLFPNMKLVINPACYHKMCESCADRLFGHGPGKCPERTCNKTLRRNKFRPQTFSDLQVEREVDIRKRVATVFNRRQEDFETLRDYNDYLNEVEDITFNLIHDIEPEKTRKRFEEHERMFEEEIRENASLESQERMDYEASRLAERRQAKQRDEAARREDAEERRAMEANKRDMLRRLENGQDPDQITQEGTVTLKKRLNRREAEQRQQQLQAASNRNGSSNLVIKGLKAKTKAEPEAPVDPFGGITFAEDYYSLQDDYVWHVSSAVRTQTDMSAGGYDFVSFANRALCEAFSGLGVMIADESTEREKLQQGEDVVGTTRAAHVAARDIKMEDPF